MTKDSAALAANYGWLAVHPDLLDGSYALHVNPNEIGVQGNHGDMAAPLAALVDISRQLGEAITTTSATDGYPFEVWSVWTDGTSGRVQVVVTVAHDKAAIR